MNSIFNIISNYEYRIIYCEKYLLDDVEAKEYIMSEEFENDISLICSGNQIINPPTLKLINKANGKYRKVYRFGKKDLFLLKIIAYTLKEKYDHIFSNNLYSYRKNFSVIQVGRKIVKTKDIDNLYCYQVDASSYDQHINGDTLKTIIKSKIDDIDAANFLCYILDFKKYIYKGKEYNDGPAAMTGNPLTPFFDNLYLLDYDEKICSEAEVYCRYCDDIIMFGSLCQMEKCVLYTKEVFDSKGLIFNDTKTKIYKPKEKVEYLGIVLSGSKMDISDFYINNIRKLVKRKTHSFLKLKRQYGLSDELTMKCAIKFIESNNDLFIKLFRLVNTTDGIKKIDRILQDAIRTVGTSKFYNGRYRIKYDQLKKLGYKNLVSMYYSWDWTKK